MAFYLNGVRVPHRKNTQDKSVKRMDAPQKVVIPMSMHIGKPATPTVKVGDLVKVGTRIGEADGAVSSPVFASVSGKVTKIQDFLLANGSTVPAIVIESDGEMTPDESITPPVVSSKEELVDAIKNSGVVGLGGAGFPTHIKFNVDPNSVEFLVINGAECEPYITSDTVTMTERRDDMAYALKQISAIMGINKAVVGIEANKKAAIASMKQLAADVADVCSVNVKVLPAIYPQGGEKVLVYHTTNKVIPVGKLPIDVGCIVINCTTLAAIGSYLKTGMPLTEKCITVDGGAVAEPSNVIAPIGASFDDVFACCGGLKSEPVKLIYGGPMMGITAPGADSPVLKNTNAVLALTEKEAKLPKTTACIRCGSCTNTCPFGLAPADIARAYEKHDTETLEALKVNACMECGCCSFICPANRPLVQTNKLSKLLLKQAKQKEENK